MEGSDPEGLEQESGILSSRASIGRTGIPRGPSESHLQSRPILTKSRSMLVPGSNVPQIVKSEISTLSSVRGRTQSWHEDSIQCVHCLRRIKREDVKNHSSTCELRTETCK